MTDFNALVEEVGPKIEPDAQAEDITIPEQPVPEQKPQENFASLVDEVASDRQSQAEALNASLMGTEAEKFAKAAELGKEFNLPPQAIMPNLGDYAAKSQLMKNNKIVRDNPSLASWVLGSPDLAPAAQDDFDHLDTLSKMATTLVQSVSGTLAQNEIRTQFDKISPFNPKDISQDPEVLAIERKAKSYDLYQPTGFYKGAGTVLSFITGLIDNAAHSTDEIALGTGAGAAAGSAAAGVGAVPGAMIGASTGLQLGMSADMGRIAATQAYISSLRQKDLNGNAMTPEHALWAAGISGGAAVGLGMIGLGVEGKLASDVAGAFTKEAVAKLMAKPTVVSSLVSISKEAAIGASKGAGIMGSFALSNMFGQEIAKAISPGDWAKITNDPALRAQYIDQFVSAAGEGAILFGAMHGLGTAIKDYGIYRQSQADTQVFSNLMDGAQESKTKSRSPDAFQSFMQSQVNNTPVESIYVSADKVKAIYDKAGKTIGADDGILGHVIADLPQQMSQALERGGDIVIPTADYAAKVAGTPMDKMLRNDIRVRQDGMSVNERAEYEAKYQDILSEMGTQFAASATANAPVAQIADEASKLALSFGTYTPKEAERVGQFIASHYAARAERLGVDPLDLYREAGISVGEPKAPARFANEITLDDLDKQFRDRVVGENANVADYLDYIKNPTKRAPKPQQTLIDFLRSKGGVQDQGGELASMDAHKVKWDRAEGGSKKQGLVREDGMTLDEAALAASEAGYIGRNGERADINTLLDAISHDLKNRNVTSDHALTPEQLRDKTAQELESILDQNDIKVEGRDNADIIKEMQEKGIIASDELFQPVYHGSPYRFEKFDLSKVGTGEGAQAYGWGQYFAEAKGVAEDYRAKLSGGWDQPAQRFFRGKKLEAGTPEHHAATLLSRTDRTRTLASARKEVKGWIDEYSAKNDPSYNSMIEGWKKTLALLNEAKSKKEFTEKPNEGQLYQVHIPDEDVARMLDWDKPLSEQGDVARVVSGLLGDKHNKFKPSETDQILADLQDRKIEGSGMEAYKALSQKLGSDKAASEALSSSGVPGIKYLDGTSRGKGEGTRNFVVFDQKLLDKVNEDVTTFYQSKTRSQAHEEILRRLGEEGDRARTPREWIKRIGEFVGKDAETAGDTNDIHAWLEGIAKEDKKTRVPAADVAAFVQDSIDNQTFYQGKNDKTKTPEFKAWFGKSKVVDENGDPLVVYHGSPDARFMKEDAVFRSPTERYSGNKDRGAFWFASDKGTANSYADDRRAFDYQNAEPSIVSSYLKMENPLIVDAEGKEWREAQARGKTSDVIEQARVEGRDGVIIKNVRDNYNNNNRTKPTDTYVVFKSEQIKSVDNRGTFNPNDPNILNQDARAKLTIANGENIITALKNPDKTSMIHELGHIWLNEMRDDALRADAPEQLKADWEIMRQHIGHEGDGLIQEAEHEIGARSLEAYLMEGMAPSHALLTVFRNFKKWFLNIYRNARNLNVELSDDVRGVFDRMLATDDEIAAVERVQGTNRIFKTKDQAGMTEEQFKAYNDSVDNTEAKAREQLFNEALEDVRKKNSAEWTRAENAMRPDVEKEVGNRPEIRTLDYFTTGKMRDGQGGEVDMAIMPMNRTDVKDMYPDQDVEKLLPRVMKDKLSDDGVHPDEIADLLGYDSGKAMVDDLIDLGKTEASIGKKNVRKYLIDQELNAKLREKFGLSPEEMQARAEELVGNHSRLEVKLAELRALGAKIGQPVRFTQQILREWSQSQIDAMGAKQAASTFQFVRAAAKAGRDAARAVERGNDQEAYNALNRQALNMAMAERAREFSKTYDSGNRLIKYIASKKTIKSTAQEYLDQAHVILRGLDRPVNRDDTELNGAIADSPLQAFVADKTNQGRDLAIPDFLLQQSGKKLENLTSVEFEGLYNALSSLLHNGRDEKTITRDGKTVALNAVVGDIVKSLQAHGEKLTTDQIVNRPIRGIDSGFSVAMDRLKSWIRSGAAALERPDFIGKWIDNNKELGPFFNEVINPLMEASYKKTDLLNEASAIFREKAEQLGKKWQKSLKDKVSNQILIDPDTGDFMKMNRARLLGVMLHMGNKDNFTRLVKGYGWDENDTLRFIHSNAVKEDFDAVQTVWDTFDKRWPEIEALYRRTAGVAPTKVEITPVETKFGTYAGGYMPIKYDKTRSKDAQLRAAFSGEIGPQYYRSTTTFNGSAINRVKGYSDKILLDFNYIGQKVNETAHDLAFREALMNAAKIINHTGFKDQFEKSFSPEHYVTMQKWLKSVANASSHDPNASEWLDKVFAWSRQGQVMMGIAFRASTVLKHGGSAGAKSAGYAAAGGFSKEFAARVATLARDPMGEVRDAQAKFGEIRQRFMMQDRDFHLRTDALFLADSVADRVEAYGHAAVAWSDMLSAVPLAWGAYDNALKRGLSEEEAIAVANSQVRLGHGSQNEVALPLIQRGSEIQKQLTMFYGFMNNTFNQVLDLGDESYRMTPREFIPLLAKTMGVIFMPAVVAGAVVGLPSQDENWGVWTAKQVGGELSATVPLVRDAVQGIEWHGGKMAGTTTPLQVAESLWTSGKDIKKLIDGEQPRKPVRDFAEAVGYLAHIPGMGQGGMTAQFLWDTYLGKEDPQTVDEWIRGVAFGHAKPASHR